MGLGSLETLVGNGLCRPDFASAPVRNFWSIPPSCYTYEILTFLLPAQLTSITAPEQVPTVPPTLDEIDVTRHREITSKAVSAILLLVLKWFKVSRKLSTPNRITLLKH
jgi:hypothetical protein